MLQGLCCESSLQPICREYIQQIVLSDFSFAFVLARWNPLQICRFKPACCILTDNSVHMLAHTHIHTHKVAHHVALFWSEILVMRREQKTSHQLSWYSEGHRGGEMFVSCCGMADLLWFIWISLYDFSLMTDAIGIIYNFVICSDILRVKINLCRIE